MGGSSKRYRNNRFARVWAWLRASAAGHANGVMFMALEDQAGHVSVIVWPSVLEAQQREVRGESLLAAYGVWQREGEVRHLVAQKLIDASYLLGKLPTASRDSHQRDDHARSVARSRDFRRRVLELSSCIR